MGIGRRELQRKIGASSNKVYYSWFETLRNCNFLMDAPKDKIHGKKVPLHLTKLSRDAFGMGILPSLIPDRFFLLGEKEEKEKEKERTVFKHSFPTGREEERKRLEVATKKAACLLLLLVQGASGTLYLSPVTNREAEPGDIIIDKKPFYGHRKRGFSISDIVEHKDVGHAWMFDYISFTKSEIEKLVKYLTEEHDPPVLNRMSVNGETRYEIADKSLAEIINYCEVTLSEVRMRIQEQWDYIKGKEHVLDPEKGFLDWYRLVFGEAMAIASFDRGKKSRQAIDDNGIGPGGSIEHSKKIIDALNESIIKMHAKIMGPEYKDTRERYPAIVEALAHSTFPPFLESSRRNNKRLFPS
jgi:hypothetical protein